MEKYDNIVKMEEIRKCIDNGEYIKANKLADGLDLGRLKSLPDLSVVADVYTQNSRYDDAMNILTRIYSKTKTRRVLYQLVDLSIKQGDAQEAEEYLELYVKAAPHDFYRFIFRYYIDRLKGASYDVLIDSLEQLKEYEYIEKWAYELAKLYHKAGKKDKCIRECSDICLWFGDGIYVEKARLLKAYYVGELNPIHILNAKDKKEMEKRLEMDKTKDYSFMKSRIDQFLREEEVGKSATDAGRKAEEAGRRAEEAGKKAAEAGKRVAGTANPEETRKTERIPASVSSLEDFKKGRGTALAEKQDSDAAEQTGRKETPAEQVIIEEEQGREEERGEEAVREEIIREEAAREEAGQKEPLWGKISRKEERREEKGLEEERRGEKFLEREGFKGERNLEREEIQEERVPIREEIQEERALIREDVQEDRALTREEIQEEVALTRETAQEERDLESEGSIEERMSGGEVPKEGMPSEEDFHEEMTSEKRELEEEDSQLRKLYLDLGIDYVKIFGSFLHVHNCKKQIEFCLEQIQEANTINYHMAVSGEKQSGKTALAKKFSKILLQLNKQEVKKIAKITGEKLDRINLEERKDVLRDQMLVIEEAGSISTSAAEQLLRLIWHLQGHLFVVLEDRKERLEELFANYPGLAEEFCLRVDLAPYSEGNLMEFALDYVEENDYRLSGEAMLVLSRYIAWSMEYLEEEERLSCLMQGMRLAKAAADDRNKKELSRVIQSREFHPGDLMEMTAKDFEHMEVLRDGT